MIGAAAEAPSSYNANTTHSLLIHLGRQRFYNTTRHIKGEATEDGGLAGNLSDTFVVLHLEHFTVDVH